jgi:hypothetical protein
MSGTTIQKIRRKFMSESNLDYVTTMVIAFSWLLFLLIHPFFRFYYKKKKLGRLDPNKTFFQNLWDAILP